jgi:DNA polymerase-3 subunit beta
MNITIRTDIFVAATLFRGIDDIRYYLNGLLLETGANGARLVGCDGHQLAVARIDGWFPEATIILPGSLVATVKAKAKGPQSIELEFKEGHQKYRKKAQAEGEFLPRDITLTFGETTTTSKELDGKFPEYRRVVPNEADGITAQFDPWLVSRVDKACSLLGYKHFVGIAQNGKSAGLSVIDEGFLVVTMPFNADPLKIAPSWIQQIISEPEQVRIAA